MVDNKSLLQFKKANCKNCYKCVRNCPVKAIRIRNQQATIIESQCILCEKCTLLCPQNAKVELNQVPEIQNKMRTGVKFIASVHPAYLAQYNGLNFTVLRDALKTIGFLDAFEAAEGGAYMKQKYEEWLNDRSENGQEKSLVISTQCKVLTLLVQRKYPELVPYLAPIPSMMETHAAILSERYPNAEIVYISPCIATMAEMNEKGNRVSYVITFAELEEWMNQRRIDLTEKAKTCEPGDIRLSRIQAIGGGLSRSMKPVSGFQYINININGIVNCMGVLNELKDRQYQGCFLDMNACINGCIGGPSFRKQPIHLLDSICAVTSASGVSRKDGEQDFSCEAVEQKIRLEKREFRTREASTAEPINEREIRAILEQMGKRTAVDELNCGACGYNTCREKAIAISQGKAEISMCVPFMRAKQENYSKKIINAMPGLLVTVDYKLNVIHMNKAAQDLFDIGRKKNLIGNPVSQIMDDYALVNMIAYDKKLSQDQVTLPDGKTCLDRVMTNDKNNQLILCVMKNITKDIEAKRRLSRSQVAAAEMADRLMEEQLRMVHQIAGLLGETAADTKVAVERLKNTILQENDTL